VGLNSLKSLNLTNGYPNKNNNNNNKVKSKPLELRSRVKIPNESRAVQKYIFEIFCGCSARQCLMLFKSAIQTPNAMLDIAFPNHFSPDLFQKVI
jgi:hypothetical protein